MNIADKSTLDKVNSQMNTLCNYEGTIAPSDNNLRPAMMYYLLEGTKVICNKSNISIVQKSGGTARGVTSGYEITKTGYTYLIPQDNNINNMIYMVQ